MSKTELELLEEKNELLRKHVQMLEEQLEFEKNIKRLEARVQKLESEINRLRGDEQTSLDMIRYHEPIKCDKCGELIFSWRPHTCYTIGDKVKG